MTTSLLIINCLECNRGLIDYWLFEHITREWWGYCSCIYPTFVYVSLKGIGVVGLDTYTWGIKDFHRCWLGSLAKRRLCLGPAGVINCTPLSALSFWVSLFPGKPAITAWAVSRSFVVFLVSFLFKLLFVLLLLICFFFFLFCFVLKAGISQPRN